MHLDSADAQVVVALISVTGGVLGTYLTVRYRDRVKEKNRPKDRMEQIFDGYESLIKQQQTDIDRKTGIITSLQGLADQLEKDLTNTRTLLDVTSNELEQANGQIKLLREQLNDMREAYRGPGTLNQ